MADQTNAPDGANPTAASSEQNPAASDGAQARTTDADAEWRNPTEIKKALQKTRETAKSLETLQGQVAQLLQLQQQQKAAPKPDDDEPKGRVRATDAMDEVKKLREELAFERTLNAKVRDAGITLSSQQAEMLQTLYGIKRPNDVAEWIDAHLPAFAAPKPPSQPATSQAAPAAPAAPPPKAKSTDSGPGGVDARQSIPTDLFSIDAEVFKGLSAQEKRQRWESFKRDRGMDFNPFAALRTVPNGKP